MNAEVSVVMPVYNCVRYVSRAIKSILGQTFSEFELVIVDDGSTDGTSTIIDRYARRDARIRVLRRANTGIVGALNDGIAAASSPLVARMDADDVSGTNRLERQLAHFGIHPECVALGTALSVIDPRGAPIYVMRNETNPAKLRQQLLETGGAGIGHATVMMRREAVLRVGGYRREYESCEDCDLWLRLDEVGALANLPDPLYSYRWHASSICHTQRARQLQLKRSLIEETCRRRGIVVPPKALAYLAELDQSSPRSSVIEQYIHWCHMAIGANNLRTARRYALRALARRPMDRSLWWMSLDALIGVERTDDIKNLYGRFFRSSGQNLPSEPSAADETLVGCE